MITLDLRAPLRAAHSSLTAAISCVETDQDAALDDMIAARLLIATVLLAVQQASSFVS